jgi:hypothetical protein
MVIRIHGDRDVYGPTVGELAFLVERTLARTLSLAVPCFYADRGPAKAVTIDQPPRPSLVGPRRVVHA